MTYSIRTLICIASIAMLCVGVALAATYTKRGPCPPGHTEVSMDCSERDAYVRACDNAHDSRLHSIGRRFDVAVAGCAVAVAAGRYRTSAACVAAAVVVRNRARRSSARVRDRCKSRQPKCIYTCEEPADPTNDPSHPSHPDYCPHQQDVMYCEGAGGTWDHYTESCNYP